MTSLTSKGSGSPLVLWVSEKLSEKRAQYKGVGLDDL